VFSFFLCIVVGPNGSGKSNVIDALLFVFGYKANKMRQGKLAELIHNSSKHPNCTECSVEIHFQEIVDGADHFTIVPNSNLVVSRSANRSSTSRYYINGRGSSFTQVTTMLKGKGIDLDHKRFLILQGEVESIALMKAKGKDGSEDGLLEYLEDIIGTSKYKEPIEEANSKLEVLNEDRAEKLSRVKYVARERDSLEDKKIEAENYLESENLLARKKNELYQIYHFEAGQNIKTAKEAIVELDAQLKEEEEKYQSIESEKKEMSETHSAAVKQFNALEATTAKTVKQQAKIEKDLVQHRERKEHVANQFEKRRQTLEDDRAARLKAQQGIKTHTETLEKDKKSSVTLEKQLKREEKQLDEISAELQGKTNEFTRQIEEHKQRLAPWTEKINEKTKAIDLKRSESDLLEETIESGQRAVKDAKQKLDTIEQTTTEKRKAMKNLPKEIKELKVELKDLEAEFVSLTNKEAEKRTELNGVRQKADEARASLQQAQSRGKVLDSIIRMRDSGRIDGIYDRLGNLGVIDDKYDVAISTACPALDNIVVETVEAAQACIEHLRKNNIGRAVFTVLSKLSFRPNDMRSIDTPDNVPRLFDLIKPKNERFAPAFYSVLRDTIVARDMSQANRIAYGKNRWRVVTLDGKLIERSGAMSGGGSGPLRGAMGSKFKGDGASPETVAKLEQERDHLEVEYRNAVEEKRATDLGLRKKKETLPRKELALEKLQMDLNSLEEQLQDETKRLEQLK
jgi:structural maintenance of chromosome 4